jgi:hypothetical protein
VNRLKVYLFHIVRQKDRIDCAAPAFVYRIASINRQTANETVGNSGGVLIRSLFDCGRHGPTFMASRIQGAVPDFHGQNLQHGCDQISRQFELPLPSIIIRT